MGYVYFLIFIAASGVIIILFWHTARMAAQGRLGPFSSKARNRLPNEPIPPFKKVISGASPEELKRIEFEERIEAFQKAHELRRANFNAAAASLQGEKYNYTPTLRNSSAAAESG